MTKINPYRENLCDIYRGHSILLLGSIWEVENKCYPQAFLHKFFRCNSNVFQEFQNYLKSLYWG